MIVAVNPGLTSKELALDGRYEIVFTFGDAEIQGEKLALKAQTFAVLNPVK